MGLVAQLRLRQRAASPNRSPRAMRMIPKSGYRFSEKIMRKKNVTSNERRLDIRFVLEPGRHRQILRAQEVRVEQFRPIARADVAQHRHDGVAAAEVLGEANGARHIDARGAAEAEALVL